MATKISVKGAAMRHLMNTIPAHFAGLRIRLIPDGCAGWTHQFSPCETPHQNDFVISLNDQAYLVIDPSTIEFIDGSTVDYVQDGLNWKLVINNPNLKVCGCGASFAKPK